MNSSNWEIAELLALMGSVIELQEGNPYRARAYSRAAAVIRSFPRALYSLTQEEIEEIPGIGRDIAGKVGEITRSGTFTELEAARSEIPPGVIEMLDVEGVGPKTAGFLWRRLNIRSVDELGQAARAHRIRSLRGFGEKKETAILGAVSRHLSRQDRMTLPAAETIAEKVLSELPEGSAYIAGSLRRGASTVGDIDIVVTEPAGRINPVLRRIATSVIEEGEKRTAIRIGNVRVDIRFSDPRGTGAMLLYLTGSKAFNIRMREMAVARGVTLNEYGIREREGGETDRFPSEEDIFRYFRMAFIPPELREDRGEVEAALGGNLPDLLERTDIKGDLHTHTDWSDGTMSLESLAQAAAAQGYDWVLCSDHAAGPGITRGMDASRLAKQVHAIEILNRDSPCEVLFGAEVDIKASGEVGIPSALLSDLDLVIGSIHSGFHGDIDVLTRRMITAIENEDIDIIGHPTGRLLPGRPPYPLDLGRVIDSARETATALECNASPFRLDLDAEFLKDATSRGVLISLGTDAHRAPDMESMHYGVLTARRGWCTWATVLNTLSANELRDWAS